MKINFDRFKRQYLEWLWSNGILSEFFHKLENSGEPDVDSYLENKLFQYGFDKEED